jgi:hypothetical protein
MCRVTRCYRTRRTRPRDCGPRALHLQTACNSTKQRIQAADDGTRGEFANGVIGCAARQRDSWQEQAAPLKGLKLYDVHRDLLRPVRHSRRAAPPLDGPQQRCAVRDPYKSQIAAEVCFDSADSHVIERARERLTLAGHSRPVACQTPGCPTADPGSAASETVFSDRQCVACYRMLAGGRSIRKEKRVPQSRRDSSCSCEPIAATRRRQMARPSPVPEKQ